LQGLFLFSIFSIRLETARFVVGVVLIFDGTAVALLKIKKNLTLQPACAKR
jgi:hypothetical protein